MRSLLLSLPLWVAFAAALPLACGTPLKCSKNYNGGFRFAMVGVGVKPEANKVDCSVAATIDGIPYVAGEYLTLREGVLNSGEKGSYYISKDSFKVKHAKVPNSEDVFDMGDFMTCEDGTIAIQGVDNKFFTCPPDATSGGRGVLRKKVPSGVIGNCIPVNLAILRCTRV